MKIQVIIDARGKKKQEIREVEDEAAVERLVAWGAKRRPDGQTVARALRVIDRHELADLAAHDAVEIERPLGVAAIDVANRAAAHRARWSCTACDRVVLEQVADLELASEPDEDADTDVLFGERGELFVHTRLAELCADIPRRPVVNLPYVQLVPPPGARLIADEPPLARRGEPCPACGRDAVGRSEDVHGSFAAANAGELWVARARPLPVATLDTTRAAVVTSDEPLGWRGVVGAPGRHVVGAALDLEREVAWMDGGVPTFIARAAWVRALLERGATGLGFRPLRRAG